MSLLFDANGNTLTDAQGRSFTWDFENRLTQAVNPGVGTTTFSYDPFGRRIQKSGPLGTTNYLYDGLAPLARVDGSGSVLARYTSGQSIDEVLSALTSSGASYYQADGLASVTSLSSTAGSLANTYTYDSFGKMLTSSGTAPNPFQYTGREADSETGQYYYRARYYGAEIGRFLSEDPIGFVGSKNFYGYTRNNPVVLVDPTGLQSRGGYGTLPPNALLNTHVCDGNGGQVPQLGNMGPPAQRKCLSDCIVRHEITHIIETSIAVPTICVGKPPGTVIGSWGLTHDITEVNASNAEINCLSEQLDKPCGGGSCREFIFQRIIQMIMYRDKEGPYASR